MNLRRTENTKQDYQMAQLTACVANMMSDHPRPVDDFLIKYMTQEEREEKQNAANVAWFEALRGFAEQQRLGV